MKKQLLTTLILATLAAPALANEDKLVIAHRGASGYLPEHTLEAYSSAYFMGADYIEQDVVMTKDNRLVVLHDHTLDRTTDVMKRYPDRYRVIDGVKRWFAIDFTLDEIKTLRVTEGFKIPDNSDADQVQDLSKAGYPERFPLWKSNFEVATFEEAIELIQGLNKSTKGNVGIYPEIKAPWLHRKEGKDISKAVLETLKAYGYDDKDDKVYVQCFDPIETKRIAQVLMPAMNIDLKVVQLLAETSWNETMVVDDKGNVTPYNYDWMFKTGAMAEVAKYADGIGPWKPMLVDDKSSYDNIIVKPLMTEAKAAGLQVHPYTFRSDKGRIAPYAKDFDDMLNVFYYKVGVDGVFTDFTDKAVKFLADK
ncbi:glycerophosphodiester phosphodiesterase [Vibrio sp. MACH09]|uniref:glycerophosphodiester phosphodiesterase n=1 Tax=Vibrio sp. MACH09 TaxID=3025122 RepID=UPI00278DA3E1|nr:glycerophosphodiester phosphodiesterase [Vibrio sp. MACH09]GLO59843.1 glycerophosphodiester phosphodiesterase [Vibrio sp. MACH09]